jgi:hypothetical protein
MEQKNGPATKKYNAVVAEMRRTAGPNQRRWILYHETLGVLLGVKINEVQIGTGKCRSWPTFYWSNEYSKDPLSDAYGCCSFLTHEEIEAYIQKRFMPQVPGLTMKKLAMTPSNQSSGNYIMPTSAISDVLDKRYLKKLAEGEFYSSHDNKGPAPGENIPF